MFAAPSPGYSTPAPGAQSTPLLEDSVLRVRQLVPTLAPGASATLAGDAYATPVTGGVDGDREYAFCASEERCYVWRSDSASPTCYEFPVARGGGAPPQCVILARPLNASAEPAVMVCSARGTVYFWDAVSDAFVQTTHETIVHTDLPLHDGELVTAAARCDESTVVFATSQARLFRVGVYVHGGAHQLAHHQFSEPRGLFGRWLGGASEAAPGGAVVDLATVPEQAGGEACLVVALSARGVQCWRMTRAGAPHALKLAAHDDTLNKTVASAALYAQGRRYSAADSVRFALESVAYLAGEHRLAVLYTEHGIAQDTDAYGVALLDLPAGGAPSLHRVVPLHVRRAADPHPGARPRLATSAPGAPGTAFVAFHDALCIKLLDPTLDALEETLRLRPDAGRVLGACVPQQHAPALRWTALTSHGALLQVDVRAAAAQQLALSLAPGVPQVHEARVARIAEQLERLVWFGEERARNPLQLDALDAHLDPELLQAAAEQLSGALVRSELACLPPAVDLRAQLALRVRCAQRLVTLIGQNGYLRQLAPSTRLLLRTDAELLAGAADLWRYYDEASASGAPGARVLSAAVAAALPGEQPADPERFFFLHRLPATPALLRALLAQLGRGDAALALEETRLLLALLFGAARFRAEHGATYDIEAPRVAYEPWGAHAVCIELLEALFRATHHALDAGAPSEAGERATDAERRSQLCALAEFLLAAYAARQTCLEARAATGEAGAAAAGDELAALRAAYAQARPAVLHPLLAIGRADRAFALAEQYRDFGTLTELCFAEARAQAKRTKRAHPEAPAEVRIERYLDTYGEPFATELYQYYIQHGALRRLLEPRAEHAPLLSAFLAAHPQHDRIAWVHYTALGDFPAAAEVLHRSARAETQRIDAQQAMLSLGKLAHLAAQTDLDRALAQPAEQARLEAWDDALDLVHVQRRLQHKWEDAVLPGAEPPEARAEMVALTVATQLAAPALRALFVQLATHVAAGRVASGEDMVDLLTLQDTTYAAPPDAALSDYAVAVQVFVRIDALPAPRKDALLGVLWRRVYLQDDWAALSTTASKSDEQVLDQVRDTAAFRTVQAVLGNESTAPWLRSPAQLAALRPPDAPLLAARFPGMPSAQVEELAAALAAERDALEALRASTKLDAFYEQVLTQPVAYEMDDEPAEPEAQVDLPGGVDTDMRTIPGSVPVSFTGPGAATEWE